MNEKELSIELNNWFKSNSIYDTHVWCRNPVGIILKKQLKSLGNWKNKERGNPSKGGRKRKYLKEVKEGYEGEFEG